MHVSCPPAQTPAQPCALTTSLRTGFARRFRLKAVQTSKACNVPSLYTRLVPVDGATQAALPTAPEVWGTGMAGGAWRAGEGAARGQRAEVALSLAAGSASRPRAATAGSWHHRSSLAGLGQQRDAEEQNEAPMAAGTDPGPYISLRSPGTCLSTGIPGDPQLTAAWGWSRLECCGCPGRGICPTLRGGTTWGGSVAAPGRSCRL